MTHTNPAYYDDTEAYEPTDHERVDVAELEERWATRQSEEMHA